MPSRTTFAPLSRIVLMLATLSLASLGAPAAEAAFTSCTTGPVVQWTPESGGNGHFYQAVCPVFFVTWSEANNAAIAAGRHLATITSSAENAFAFGLIDDQDFWYLNAFNCNIGPWLGGLRSSPGGPFTWVTGEALGFTAWSGGEPNNSGGTEDKIHFFNCAGGEVRSANWNDVTATVPISGYVAEWEHSLDVDGDGEVLPLTDGLLVLRYRFGFTGATLTTGAVDLADCTRCDAAAIEPFLALLAGGIVYDVTQDWSDSMNPNGPWAYLQGTTPLAHQSAWVPGSFTLTQPAWATAASGPGHVPAFFKSVEPEDDYLAGDILIHSRDDASGGGQGDARLRLTVPATGLYRVDLDLWIARDIGRSVPWALSADGMQIDTGTVASGDAFSRASPDGYTGSLALEAGDLVDLTLLTPASVAGDLVGVRLRLEAFGIDVDGDGETEALTDGLLVLRRLFGFSGPTLVTGAVDLVNCTRCDAPAIEGFFDAIGAP